MGEVVHRVGEGALAEEEAQPISYGGCFSQQGRGLKEFAEEEEAFLALGSISLHAMTASMFIVLRLELEEDQ